MIKCVVHGQAFRVLLDLLLHLLGLPQHGLAFRYLMLAIKRRKLLLGQVRFQIMDACPTA